MEKVKRIIDKAYNRAVQILSDNIESINACSMSISICTLMSNTKFLSLLGTHLWMDISIWRKLGMWRSS